MVATTETFHNVLQVIQTSCLNYRLELSPFSATIYLKNSSIKDKNGNPLSISPTMIDNQLERIKSENDELCRKISQQDKIIEILQTIHYGNAAAGVSKQTHEARENLEVKLHQTHSFPHPPPGYPILQPRHREQVPQVHDDTKYAELSRNFCELQNEFKTLESCKEALEKDLEFMRKVAEDVEKKTAELEKVALELKTENDLLRESNKDLENDARKIKSDYLEVSKKVASQFSEYQEKVKELSEERIIIQNRKFKKEEKIARKKANKEKKANNSEIVNKVELRCGDREENDGVNFACTICAQFCGIEELSSKSVPEEHDSCKACNAEDTSLEEPHKADITKPAAVAVDEPNDVIESVNVVHYFWNGDLHVNKRLAIDYINMCQYSNHDCDECSYISVINEGVAPGRTGGWSMQFCKKFNFKLGDALRDPPYILGSLPPT